MSEHDGSTKCVCGHPERLHHVLSGCKGSIYMLDGLGGRPCLCAAFVERPSRLTQENRIELALEVCDGAAVVFEDPRVDYVELQVDRQAWMRYVDLVEAIRKWTGQTAKDAGF